MDPTTLLYPFGRPSTYGGLDYNDAPKFPGPRNPITRREFERRKARRKMAAQSRRRNHA